MLSIFHNLTVIKKLVESGSVGWKHFACWDEFLSPDEQDLVDGVTNSPYIVNLPEEQISVQDIIPCQPHPPTSAYVGDEDPIILLRRSGKTYVIDGHHRLAAATKSERTISAHMINLPEHEVNAPQIASAIGCSLNELRDAVHSSVRDRF